MSEINKKNSSKKKIKKKRVKRTYSEGPYESVENVYKKLAVEHELSISLTKWDQGRIRDKKSTFGIRLPESVQYEIKRAARASGTSISKYISNIHDASIRQQNYSLLMYAHDQNYVVRLLKLQLLCSSALDIFERKTIYFLRHCHKLWVGYDPRAGDGPQFTHVPISIEDNMPRIFVIIKNYKTIEEIVRKNKSFRRMRSATTKLIDLKANPIYGSAKRIKPRDVVYEKKPRPSNKELMGFYDGDKDPSFSLDYHLTQFEQDIEDRYIEIFKLLQKIKLKYENTSEAAMDDVIDDFLSKYSKAYEELYELLGYGRRMAREHDPSYHDWDNFETDDEDEDPF